MTADLDAVRGLGRLTETLHAVVYFAPEPAHRYTALGLRGYWRGYFASRAAAVGTPSAPLVTALFGGFDPAFVARAVPEVWTIAGREQVLAARAAGAAAALRRLLPDDQGAALTEAVQLTGDAVAGLDVAGRPMAAAHASLDRPRDPAAALWHDCTVLREHRGDGHLAVVAAAGLRWPIPHLLAAPRLEPRQQAFRGWADDAWQAAAAAVQSLPPELPDLLEGQTDQLAAPAYEGIDVERLSRLLVPLAKAVTRSGGVPFPNAMGLPSPLTAP